MIFAQAPEWAGWVQMISTIGFSGAVGWYLLTKAIPKMFDDFRAEIAATREHHDKMQESRRVEHKDALDVVVAHCREESERRDEALKHGFGVVEKVIGDNREVLEEVRDTLVKVQGKLA